MARKKKEVITLPLEGKTAAELRDLISSGSFGCPSGRRFFSLYRYKEGRFYGSLTMVDEGSQEFSISEEELLKELRLWTYHQIK